MSRLSIPQPYLKGFELFLALKEPAKKKLMAEIEKAPAGFLPEELSKRIAKNVKINVNELEAILQMLHSLFRARETSDVELKEFVESIVYALNECGTPKLRPNKAFAKQLIRILSTSDSFRLTTKAVSLLNAHGRLFLDSDIFTDLRPIFTKGKTPKMDGVVIVHNMRIEYGKDGSAKESFFSINSKNLKELKKKIAVAEENELELRQQLVKGGIRLIESK